jgi:hypothetical protein
VTPVLRVAEPLAPGPLTSLEKRSMLPEPVEMPTPVDRIMPPPAPLLEELEPAEI